MIVVCLFFAESRELAETREYRFELADPDATFASSDCSSSSAAETEPGCGVTVSAFRENVLLKSFPALKQLSGGFLFALNQKHLSPQQERTTVLSHLDELAIIPPLSGG